LARLMTEVISSSKAMTGLLHLHQLDGRCELFFRSGTYGPPPHGDGIFDTKQFRLMHVEDAFDLPPRTRECLSLTGSGVCQLIGND